MGHGGRRAPGPLEPGAQTRGIAPSVPQDCQNRCCNTTTCQLAEGAECAHGACCHECRVSTGPLPDPSPAMPPSQWVGRGPRDGGDESSLGPAVPMVSFTLLGQVMPAGKLCRPGKDTCDLAEFCDGQRPSCPEDVFQENGTPCLGGYCYNGACPTRAQRCQDLWGPGEAGGRAPTGLRVASGPMLRTHPLLACRRTDCPKDVLLLQHLTRLHEQGPPWCRQVSIQPSPIPLAPGMSPQVESPKKVLCTKEEGPESGVCGAHRTIRPDHPALGGGEWMPHQ